MTTEPTNPLIAARRNDSDRRRRKVLDALDRLRTNGDEITVSAVARTALLTELKRKSAHVNGNVAVSGVTVTARDRRW